MVRLRKNKHGGQCRRVLTILDKLQGWRNHALTQADFLPRHAYGRLTRAALNELRSVVLTLHILQTILP
jgi:hypothetical protein